MTVVRSERLGANDAVTNTVATLYTVGTGKRTIVKSITLRNNTGSANRAIIYVYNGATVLFQLGANLAANASAGDTVILLPWFVMNAGETLKVQAASSSISVSASGAELTLP